MKEFDITKYKWNDKTIKHAIVDKAGKKPHVILWFGFLQKTPYLELEDAIAIAKHFGIYSPPPETPGGKLSQKAMLDTVEGDYTILEMNTESKYMIWSQSTVGPVWKSNTINRFLKDEYICDNPAGYARNHNLKPKLTSHEMPSPLGIQNKSTAVMAGWRSVK